ncbi:hypothetical protein POM88_048341 [Heracleum sosnowskyi]|uniref:Helitron helicase-like domain-containing protein n=1 Tax=Heracleum sosnowskyi TaxID=360622 RepID=A0AAD8GTN2_9APIA|nr:hypothetical protein POM88_048341 [Heracleum sosnowskyi]
MSSSQLFTSDDMMKGFQKCPGRRKKIRKDKENMDINKSNGSVSPLYPLSEIFNTPTVSSPKHILGNCEILNTPTSASVNKSTASSLKPKPNMSFVNKSLHIQTSSSGAVRSIDMECINKNDADTMDRQPLSNITNHKSHSISKSQKEKGKGKLLNGETTRNLFEEEFQSPTPQRSDDYYDQLEHSIIGDSEYNEDGTDDSNDEYCTEEPWGEIGDIDSDVETLPSSSKLPKKTRRSCQIPEDYATLGGPSVKCTQCNALMWKEERVNKNVTKGTPIFSLCCKKGDVKLANALAIPPYLLQLYNDEVGDSAEERDMISMKDYYSYRFQVRENEGMTARVFKMKLDQMTNDIKKKSYFGKCVGIMYVVEFQMRGLPHGLKCIRHFPKKYYLANLWCCHWKQMVEDILLKRRHLSQDINLTLNDKQLQYYALAEIDDLLRSIGKSLTNFPQLPQPPSTYLNHGVNNLIIEETRYNMMEMECEYKKLVDQLNQEQLGVYEKILQSIKTSEGGLFFVYGSGGCDMGRCLEDDIVIPPQFCDLKNDNSVDNMIKATYPDFLKNCQDPKFLSERAILTPTNQTVGHLNSLIVEKLPAGISTDVTQNVVYREVFYALPRL